MLDKRLLPLAMLFMACLLTANIIAVKILALPFGLLVPAGILVFPLSYAFNDLISELWGFPTMRRVILLGFFGNLVAVLAIVLAGALPAAPFWSGQGAYNAVLGFAPRLLVASFSAYLVGETVNSAVFVRVKRATRGRHLWLRAIGSTAVGEALDTTLFLAIAFAGVIPGGQLAPAMLTQWTIKVLYEVVATPLTYLAVRQYVRKSPTPPPSRSGVVG